MGDDELYDGLLQSMEDWADECDRAAAGPDPVGALQHLAVNLRQARMAMSVVVAARRKRDRDR